MDTPRTFLHARHSAGAFATRAHVRPTDSLPRTVVIVGAGFSGTAVAIHLLRLPQPAPLRIVLIDRAPTAGGLAYAIRERPYLLNVPAGRMSASSVDPLEFLAYAQRTLPNATAEDFLPRELYGQYLEASLLNAAQAMNGKGDIQIMTAARNGNWTVEVHDSGPGIPPDIRQQVLEPFFTTKARGGGLGLPIAKRVAELHGGTLTLAFPPAGGTVVSVEAPAKPPAPMA